MHLIELAALFDLYGDDMTPEEQKKFRQQEMVKGAIGVAAVSITYAVILAFSYVYGV